MSEDLAQIAHDHALECFDKAWNSWGDGDFKTNNSWDGYIRKALSKGMGGSE